MAYRNSLKNPRNQPGHPRRIGIVFGADLRTQQGLSYAASDQ